MSPTENILADYVSRAALALQLEKSERTLARWEVLRIGPAVTKIGQQPYYRIETVRAWLRSREQQMPRTRARNLRAAASA
jgi:hypothetical protein